MIQIPQHRHERPVRAQAITGLWLGPATGCPTGAELTTLIGLAELIGLAGLIAPAGALLARRPWFRHRDHLPASRPSRSAGCPDRIYFLS
jgi:uncharacterized membrane protein YedE/YeeE